MKGKQQSACLPRWSKQSYCVLFRRKHALKQHESLIAQNFWHEKHKLNKKITK